MSNQLVYEHAKEALDYLVPLIAAAKWCTDASFATGSKLAIICGSGLGQLYETLDEIHLKVSYASIPHFAKTQVVGHANQLIFGSIMSGDKKLPVIIMLGRLHCYEGLKSFDTIFPMIVLRLIGVSTILITNASGGVNKAMRKGDIMIIRDHINMPSITGGSPLVGPIVDAGKFSDLAQTFKSSQIKDMFHESGLQAFDRFPNLNGIYDRPLSQTLYKSFLSQFTPREIHSGVYFYNFGPCYESPAEIDLVRRIGGDAVGMSTLPEVIMARELGIKTVAFALITNECSGLKESNEDWLKNTDYLASLNGSTYQGPTHTEVIGESKHQAIKITASIKDFLLNFPLQ